MPTGPARLLACAVAAALLAAGCSKGPVDDPEVAAAAAAEGCAVVADALELLGSAAVPEVKVADMATNRWGAPSGTDFTVRVVATVDDGAPAAVPEVAAAWRAADMAVIEEGSTVIDEGELAEWQATTLDGDRYYVGANTFDDGTSKVFVDAEMAPSVSEAAAAAVTEGPCPAS
jgi:hypothetical protein